MQPFKIKINAREQTPLKSRVMSTLAKETSVMHFMNKNVNGFELPILEEKNNNLSKFWVVYFTLAFAVFCNS